MLRLLGRSSHRRGPIDAAHLARRAADFGVSVAGPVTVDMKKVKERKDYVLGFSTRGVERALRSNPNITVYQGHARFAWLSR